MRPAAERGVNWMELEWLQEVVLKVKTVSHDLTSSVPVSKKYPTCDMFRPKEDAKTICIDTPRLIT